MSDRGLIIPPDPSRDGYSDGQDDDGTPTLVGRRIREAASWRPDFGPRPKFGDPGMKIGTRCQRYPVLIEVGPDLERIHKQCGRCAACRLSKRSFLTNQACMELEFSDWAYWMTLTIRPHDDRFVDFYDKVLSPVPLQLFHKRMRNNLRDGRGSFFGRKATSWRYFAAGEYGSLRGRAHFHELVFGTGDRPDFPLGHLVHIPEWTLGHVSISEMADRGHAWYCSKYATKSDYRDSFLTKSLKPVLGSSWLVDLAIQWAERGNFTLARDFSVSMEGVSRRYRATLKGANRRDYILAVAALAGCDPLAFLIGTPKSMHYSIFAAERFKRELEQKAARKAEPERWFEEWLSDFGDDLRGKGLALARKRGPVTLRERWRIFDELRDRDVYVPPDLLPVTR